MKKTPSIIDTYYKSLGTKIFRDTTALPFADGGPLNDRNIHGDLLPSVYASALGRYYSNGGKFLTVGGEYHRIYKNPEGDIMVNHPQEDKGKWDTINLTEKSNANTIADGVKATQQWHEENPNSYANGGMLKRADGSYSPRGLWDNIRANAGSGKEPTKEMLSQERKINNEYGSGGQMQPDYSLPEDSFQQGGRGLKNSVYASSMGQYPANYAEGGAMNQYPDGGSVYTYAKRPGSYYQKDSEGNWLISNKGTGGQYVPIDDPSGQRAAALNKGAVVSMANPTASKYDNVTPSYGKSPMVQSVAGRTEVNPNANVFGSPSQNLNQGLSAIGINSMANVPNQDGLLENAVEFMDPSGVSSWDDASSAKDEWSASGNLMPTAGQAMDMFGAVPGLGKLGKLKYLSNAPDALKAAYKYISWQQILNGIDTVEDIDNDNNSKNLPVQAKQSN